MMDNEQWKIQNKLYRMKARKSELERFIETTQIHYDFLNKYSLLTRQPEETRLEFFIDVIKLFLTGLDIVLGFYYNRYKAFFILKRAKKEILTLTKEIKYYEQY